MILKKIKTEKFIWIDIENPKKETIEKLGADYDFHVLDIEDALSKKERTNAKKRENYTFIMLCFPQYNRETRNFDIRNLNFFVGEKFLISIHSRILNPLKNLFIECEDGIPPSPYTFTDTAHLLYTILRKIFLDCFLMSDHLNNDIEEIEKKIFHGQEKEKVKEISIIKRNVIDFRKTMWPQKDLYHDISNKIFTGDVKIYFEDLENSAEKIWQILREQKEMIESLEETNQTLITHKTNNIMKILMVFSVIITPLTLIANIYSMNVTTLPFVNHPFSLWIVLGMMFFIVIIMLSYFLKKKWI